MKPCLSNVAVALLFPIAAVLILTMSATLAIYVSAVGVCDFIKGVFEDFEDLMREFE